MIWVIYISKLVFLEKINFQLDLGWKLACKNHLEEILEEIGKENEFWKKFHLIKFFYLDAFGYNNWYWKASLRSTLNDFNNGLDIFHDLSSFFNKNSASWKCCLKTLNSNLFFKKRKSTSILKIFLKRKLLWDESLCPKDLSKMLSHFENNFGFWKKAKLF